MFFIVLMLPLCSLLFQSQASISLPPDPTWEKLSWRVSDPTCAVSTLKSTSVVENANWFPDAKASRHHSVLSQCSGFTHRKLTWYTLFIWLRILKCKHRNRRLQGTLHGQNTRRNNSTVIYIHIILHSPMCKIYFARRIIPRYHSHLAVKSSKQNFSNPCMTHGSISAKDAFV